MASTSSQSSWSGVPLPGNGGDPTAISSQQLAFQNMGLSDPFLQPAQNVGANAAQSTLQQAQSTATALMGTGQQAQQAGIQAAQPIQQQANNLQQTGQSLVNMGQQNNGQFAQDAQYANQALQNAFDPQQAQYKANLAQLNDATQSQLTSSGLEGTPYGASIVAGADSNFQNQWQTAQIQRENTGASTAEGLQGQVLSAQQQNSADITAGGSLMTASGQLDSSAMQSILGGYGLNEQSQQAAVTALNQIFGNLGISTSSQSSASSGQTNG
jgi:hypothetical protein